MKKHRPVQVSLRAASLAVMLSSPCYAQSESQSGYDRLKEFGGPESVGSQIRDNDAERESIYQFDNLQSWWKPYFDWKRKLLDEQGVALSSSLHMLYQQASDSLPGQDDDALGYIFRQQGSWTLVGRNGGNTGRIEWRLESRADAGNMQSPSQLGGAIGAGPLGSGFGYSPDFDLDLAVINWTQGVNNNKAGFAVGRLGFDAYLDAFPFQTLSKGFMNRGFILNPTMGTTGIGAIGAVTRGFLGDSVWIGAQMHDANAVSGDFDFDTVREGEWLKAVEVGYTPSFAERKSRLLQISYWEKDARELAGTTRGSGWVVSTAWQVSEHLFPFVRYGHSDGGAGVPAEQSVAAGIQITQAHDNAISLGLSWAEPSEETYGPGRDNEWVVEASWKFQMSKNFSLSPDIQLIRNPVNNPDESSVWVFGLRGILTL